jgi:hypothetical protein
LIDGSKCNFTKILNPKCAFSITLPVIQLFVVGLAFGGMVWWGLDVLGDAKVPEETSNHRSSSNTVDEV